MDSRNPSEKQLGEMGVTPDSGIDLSKFNIVDFVLEGEEEDCVETLLETLDTSPMCWDKLSTASTTPTHTNQIKPWTEDYVSPSRGGRSQPALRTLSKQELQRRKALEDSRREKELERKSQDVRSIEQSRPVDLPPFSTPPDVQLLPKDVLQVATRLENPTRYHIEQCVRNNIARYAQENIGGGGQGGGSVPHTLGTHHQPIHLNLEGGGGGRVGGGLGGGVGSAPPTIFRSAATPLSPLGLADSGVPPSPGPTISSVATSITSGCSDTFEPFATIDNPEISTISLSEINEIISAGDGEALFSTYTTNNEHYKEGTSGGGFDDFQSVGGVGSVSLDSPRTPSSDDPVKAVKDRQKKDNHNKIERRRRFHINDMISIQGQLLPKPNEAHFDKFGDIKQNKGAILQASVEYTKMLKDENESLRDREAKVQLKLQQMEQDSKKYLLRIQELEELCRRSGVSLAQDSLTWKPQPDRLNSLINGPLIIKEEPGVDILMEEDRGDGGVVTGGCDPMLGQSDPDEVVLTSASLDTLHPHDFSVGMEFT